MSYSYCYTTQDTSDEDSDDGDHFDHDYDVPVARSKKNINKGRWTKDEDEKLKKICLSTGTADWKTIAGYFNDRNDIQCQHRWQKVLNPELIKGPWTKEEDEKVLQLVRIHGPKRWTLISKQLKGRTGKQCRERWHNHLNPEIKKCAWTEEEDRLIYQLHKRMGNRWAEIAKYLPGRTDNAIKNHWNSTMRRKFENEEETRAVQAKLPQSYTPSAANSLQGLQPVRLFQNVKSTSSNLANGSSVVVKSVGTLSSPTGYNRSGKDWEHWKMVDTSGIVSPLKCIPEFAEAIASSEKFCDMTTYELLSGTDVPPGVTPIKFTSLNKKGTLGYRFDGHAISSLKEGGLISITSPVVSRKLTTPKTPTILRKSKRKRANPVKIIRDEATDELPKSVLALVKSPTPKTPKGTPIKLLPFSPSQFLNSPDLPFGGKVTSTPVCSFPDKATPLSLKSTTYVMTKDNETRTFRTPKIRRSIWEAPPRTPTPFKNALAELEKKNGAVKVLPETPSRLVEDINEVIQRDTGSTAFNTDPGSYKRKKKENVSPSKKIRSSLESRWSTPGDIAILPRDHGFVPETPSKSLIGDNSIVFSPPSILKDTLSATVSLNEAFTLPTSPAPKQTISVSWETVACGRTLDQLQMTEQARYLLKTKPRSLVL